jgi:RNA recognition motif-containing protein
LREAVECYGPVEIVTVIKNHQTQKSKGCGFVKFVFREDAMAAYLVRSAFAFAFAFLRWLCGRPP